MTDTVLKIGTRGSPLALIQTGMVEDALKKAHPGLKTERVIIKTSGDWKPEDGETKLSEKEGGKGLFVREIEKALLDGSIDCAVHSLKDMPSFLPDGLALDHMLERADPRDAFICHKAKSFTDLPHGATIGTSAARRAALLLSRRPDLKIMPLRGNVQTRLDKLANGLVDATFLARAGLDRLNIKGDFIHTVSADDLTPACGQGIVAVETRVSDLRMRELLDPIHHAVTGICASIERAALQTLDGSCHTPIGAFAKVDGGSVKIDLVVASLDGQRVYKHSEEKPVPATMVDGAAIGAAMARHLKTLFPADLLQ